MDNKVMFNISYGLFVLTAKSGGKDNGCIINTAQQLTDIPLRMSVTVNKSNLTCKMIEESKKFAVSILDQSADFSVFQHFGFKSGRDDDKIGKYDKLTRSAKGLLHMNTMANGYIDCEVISQVDLGTHLLFVADVVDGEILSNTPSTTYTFYQANIKPKPIKANVEENGYTCTLCGYQYKGDVLPADFICPLCKHSTEYFKKNTK